MIEVVKGVIEAGVHNFLISYTHSVSSTVLGLEQRENTRKSSSLSPEAAKYSCVDPNSSLHFDALCDLHRLFHFSGPQTAYMK